MSQTIETIGWFERRRRRMKGVDPNGPLRLCTHLNAPIPLITMSQISVPNICPKYLSQIPVPNTCPKYLSQIPVPNTCPKYMSQISVPNTCPTCPKYLSQIHVLPVPNTNVPIVTSTYIGGQSSDVCSGIPPRPPIKCPNAYRCMIQGGCMIQRK
eukprot:GHVO01013671.1.p3 GENE.GHVO01013671.1~~GHVO01013671.1.p3  ORF type:complete len:155 (-),score=65.63 GHVO01013671.1:113-577(-)